jgi:hypothetical protein
MRQAGSINRSLLLAKFGKLIGKNARSQGGPDSPVPDNGLGRRNRRQIAKRRRICMPIPALEFSWRRISSLVRPLSELRVADNAPSVPPWG